MGKKSGRGRKMQSHKVYVSPKYREEVDVQKLSYAIISMVRDMSIAPKNKSNQSGKSDKQKSTD